MGNEAMSKLKNPSLLIYSIALAGFTVSLLAFWPGCMSPDSFDQYGQAIGQQPLDDWHPVAMTLLWRGLVSIYDGPQPMLLLQMVLYWSGFMYLALHVLHKTSRFTLAISAIAVPFLPFLLNFSGVLWKDTHLAISLFWAALLLVLNRSSRNKLLGSILLIFYAISVRHNGLAAALPILILWMYKFAAFTGFKGQYRIQIIAVCTALTFFLIYRLFSDLIVVERSSLLNDQLLNELAFIKCQSNDSFDMLQVYYDDALMKLNERDRQTYLCNQIYSLAYTGDTGDIYEIKVLKDPDYDDANIKTLWIKNVSSHPLLYLKYRLIVYRTFLRPFSYAEPYYPFCDGKDENPYSFRFSAEALNPLKFNTLLGDYVRFASKNFNIFFRPFFWLITLAFTAVFSLQKRSPASFLVSLSGLSYLILYILFLPAPDFRYAYYAIFAQVLSVFMVLGAEP
jgi:hypothetical protein